MEKANIYLFQLIVFKNIILLFQFSKYGIVLFGCRLNPIERAKQYIDQQLKNLFFPSLNDVKYKVDEIIQPIAFLSETED